jgi:hypothetical protein
MAVNETVGINLVADTKSLRSQLREATQELARLQNSATASAEEIRKAAVRAGELKDRIGDAKATIDAFNPDAKFRAIGTVVQGVAGAFSAVQGALALVGVESEDVQKTLLKVQGALALSQGLNSVLELKDGFNNLKIQVLGSSVAIAANSAVTAIASRIMRLFGAEVVVTSNAFKVLKTAIASTGIGLLIVGLGAAVVAFQKYTAGAEEAAKAQEELNKKQAETEEKLRGKSSEFIDYLTKRNIAEAKARGATQAEIFELEKQGRNININSQKEYIKELQKLGQSTLEQEYELKQLERENEVATLEYKASVNEKYRAQQLKKQEAYLAAQEKLRQEEVQRFNENLQQEGAVQLEAYEKEIEMFNETIQQEGEQAFKEYDKLNNLRFQQSFELYENDIELLLRLANAKEDDFQQDLIRYEQVKLNLEAQKNLELEAVEGTEDAEIRKLEILKKYGKLTIDINDKILNTEKAQIEARTQLQLKYVDIVGKAGALLQQAAGDNKALAIAGIVLEQASAVASIAINTQKNAARAGYLTPVGIAELAAGALGIASAIVAAKQGIDNINKANIPGPSAPASAPSISAPIAPRFSPVAPTRLDQASLNTINNVVARAYVVESDITGKQKRIKRIENAARI